MKIIDLHTDFVLTLYSKGAEYNINGQISKNLLKKSQVKIFFSGFSYDNYFKDTEFQWKTMINYFKNNSDFEVIKDIHNLNNEKIGVIYHMEGGSTLKNSKLTIQDYYKLGLRSIGLTHNKDNFLCGGCMGKQRYGLTSEGKKVLSFCNSVPFVLDCAHISPQGLKDVLKYYKKPIMISHTALKSINNKDRNISDDQVKSVIDNDGVIGLFFDPENITNKKIKNIKDVVEHYYYFAEHFGTDNLCIGSDFGGMIDGTIDGLNNHLDLINNLVPSLLKVGFSQTQIDDILYNNSLRFLQKVLK